MDGVADTESAATCAVGGAAARGDAPYGASVSSGVPLPSMTLRGGEPASMSVAIDDDDTDGSGDARSSRTARARVRLDGIRASDASARGVRCHDMRRRNSSASGGLVRMSGDASSGLGRGGDDAASAAACASASAAAEMRVSARSSDVDSDLAAVGTGPPVRGGLSAVS